MDEFKEEEVVASTLKCVNCGVELKYKPGTQSLVCEYCGAENEIKHSDSTIEELDFNKFLKEKASNEDVLEETFVKCNNCGASSTLEPNITAADCPYCASPLIIDHVEKEGVIKPKSILPFKVDKDEAKGHFKKWISKLWFAPGDLKKASLNFDHFKGIYIPYWTYDMDTFSKYTGERGTYYYVTQTYTTTENGKTVTKSRQVRKTRWRNVSGSVRNFFDDILVVATKSLTKKYINKLEPWDLENLVPFNTSYLSGFVTERYQTDLEEGFSIAKDIADDEIRNLVRKDIGGDEQRISSLHTDFTDITFKHLLLPVFVCAYKYKGKLYQFLVNGRTGEVQGNRPYSWIKITLTVLLGLLIIGGIVFAITQNN